MCGYTLNLAVQKALQIHELSIPIARCRKLVTYFHKSRVDGDELKKKQSVFPGNPKHRTHYMVQQVCKQQLAINGVLLQHRDLIHLEMLPNEWRILEDILQLLKPFNIATQHLSGEKYPTISALGPLLNEIQSIITVSDDDSNTVKEFKRVLRQDLDGRYVDPNIKFLLHKASFLDPGDTFISGLAGRNF